MERESCLTLVRDLTEQVITAICPEMFPDFADDFADFAFSAGVPRVSDASGYQVAAGQGLETTLVAGMFFEVLQEAAGMPFSAGERVSFVRKRAKDYLVTHLSGQITLRQFYRLLNLIEVRVGDYFSHLASDWTGAAQTREACSPPEPKVVEAEALRAALARLPLPLKGRRKLTPETLWDFLTLTGGGWFRLLDFEARFQINKKTAWNYLNLLLSEGVLEHNGEKANRVRYALAPTFKANPAKPPGA